MRGDPIYFHYWSMAQRPDQPGIVIPVGFLAQANGIIDLHKEMRAYTVMSPSGTLHYAERASGGELGTDLNEINKFIDETPDHVLIYQLKMNVETSMRIRFVNPEEFWFLIEYQGPIDPKLGLLT